MSTTRAEAPVGEIIQPPNALRAKVGGRFAGVDPVAIARAEAALQELAGEFAGWMQEEVSRLEESRARRHAEGPTQAAMDALHLCAHDLKGLGATYGFPLATRICASLGRLLQDPAARAGAPPSLIDAHVDAVRAVVRDDIRDPSHPMGLDLCAALETRVTEHTSSRDRAWRDADVEGRRRSRV